ncbi:MAG TPA: QsdR family transcriptional regulator [Pseudonocardia sp.]|jgi:AcrR family transcriptional regulator|nr:QsdR family transcriptional regulator [Pseudonocardia sp.]
MVSDPRERRREDGKARILDAARERYVRGHRIELATLAAEQGISRASAYRWLGDNDRLLAEVLGERVRENFDARVREHTGKSGRDRVLSVVDGFLRHAAGSERLEALLRREPNRVLKILASSAHGVQQMVVRLFEDLLSEEQGAGHVELPVPAHTLAYGIVRLLEAYLYADVVAGEERDIESAVQIIGLLMPERLNGAGPASNGNAVGSALSSSGPS